MGKREGKRMLMNPLNDAERKFEENERELWNQLMAEVEPREEPVYRLTDQPTKAIVQEEIRLLDRLRRGIDEHVDPELAGEERQARIHELLAADAALADVAERLERLSRSHDESVMLGLARLAEEEEKAEGEDWSL
ncbi:MAG: hypothetical protein ACTHNP_06530 [Solirubrobacterales bacterium]